ncbi:hypothetical protein HCN44_003285 [Aphidius gifuensis]|uniref:Odorant-binding protein n=1 Tax=Aphidius gifuensis TaxID=684658 RepID=A0A834XI77_APHGI|nr:uncharacterized protein LOC122859033 [Aphidius gifuensis]KAF7987523.1 hypothetical protein HCN44_003285 [Aphidius gifuensis]
MKFILVVFLFSMNLRENNSEGCYKNQSLLFDECMINFLPKVMDRLKDGKILNDSNFLMEPLSMKNITVDSKNYLYTIKDIEIHGLVNDLKIEKFLVDWQNNIFYLDTYNPMVTIDGKCYYEKTDTEYKINGQMCSIKLENLHTSHVIAVIQGKAKASIKNWEISLSPVSVFTNEPEKFGKPILGFLSSMMFGSSISGEIYEEIQQSLEDSLSRKFIKLANEILETPLESLSNL